MRRIKKIRNQSSAEVNKYKGRLTGAGIVYDEKFAHVYVSNPATEGIQRLRWDWLTSTTGSHSKQVEEFKQIIEALEAKNNPAQYENLVSAFDFPTKQAFDATVREYNITVPSSTTDLPNEINSFGQQEKIPNINPTVSSSEEPLKEEVQNVNSTVSSSEEPLKEEVQNVNSTVSSSEEPLKEEVQNVNSTVSSSEEPLKEEMQNINPTVSSSEEPLKKEVQNVNSTVSSSEEPFKEEVQNVNIDTTTTPSSETSKILLAEKVALTNGAEFEVKTILKCLSNKSFINMILDEVTPEIRGPLEKEMVLRAVYNVNQGLISKKDAGNIIASFDCLSISNQWLEYNGFTNEEIKSEEVMLTGGPSYLE